MEKQLFTSLQQLADGITAMFGRNCEVAVHDLRDLRKSLVYIAGEVTGRRAGAPATDLLVRACRTDPSEIEDIYNYKTSAHDGRLIKSSTMFLRDQDDTIIAAFCINLDTTEFFNASRTLAAFLNGMSSQAGQIKETFARSVEETIDALFDQALIEIGKSPASMVITEKIRLITLLEEHGVFQMKGAIKHVAALTGVSKYTIYNYLKKVRTIKSQNIINS